MERENRAVIPRRKGAAGYGKGKPCRDTPPQRGGGVWKKKTMLRYPGAKSRRGMERENRAVIPRRKGAAGYGKRKPRRDTPPQRADGVWKEKTTLRYPGAKGRRGMGRENSATIPRRKGAAGYGKGKPCRDTPPQRGGGVWKKKTMLRYPAAKT